MGVGVCVVALGVVYLGVEVFRYSRVQEPSPADAAVVLGAAVWNGRPSPVLQERIDHAVRLYREGTVRYLIFTGGKGTNDPFTESLVASQYAMDRGVSPEDAFCETQSRTTWGNLQGVRQIVDGQGLGRVVLVSDPFHLRRSVAMARDLGLDADPSPTPTTRFRGFETQLEFLLREMYLYGLYLGQKPFVDLEPLEQDVVVGPCRDFEPAEPL